MSNSLNFSNLFENGLLSPLVSLFSSWQSQDLSQSALLCWWCFSIAFSIFLSLGTQLPSLSVDIIIRYLNEKNNTDTGIKRPWNFLFSKDYWRGYTSITADSRNEDKEQRAALLDATTSLPPDLQARDDEDSAVGLKIDKMYDEDCQFLHVIMLTSDLKHIKLERVLPRSMLWMDIPIPFTSVRLSFDFSSSSPWFSGEIYCLLGHNGAGKSTLLGILTGMLHPTSGSLPLIRYDTTLIYLPRWCSF